MNQVKSIAALGIAGALLAVAPAFAQPTTGASPAANTGTSMGTTQGNMSGGMMRKDPDVGGAPMYPNKDIVANAVNSKDHTTLVKLVQEAGLVKTLQGPGPFTVFAPTNEAFGKLDPATVAAVQKPENKALLTKILTYHVVAGSYDSKAIAKLIAAGNGSATLTTVEGEPLKASMSGNNLILTDAKGGTSTVTTADVYQSNGVIHVVDTVLMP